MCNHGVFIQRLIYVIRLVSAVRFMWRLGTGSVGVILSYCELHLIRDILVLGSVWLVCSVGTWFVSPVCELNFCRNIQVLGSVWLVCAGVFFIGEMKIER